jgi:hypothetical protein
MDRQYNGQRKNDKRTNNDLQNTTQKSKDRVTRTLLIMLKLALYHWITASLNIANYKVRRW